jgi:hypothetical protein
MRRLAERRNPRVPDDRQNESTTLTACSANALDEAQLDAIEHP